MTDQEKQDDAREVAVRLIDIKKKLGFEREEVYGGTTMTSSIKPPIKLNGTYYCALLHVYVHLFLLLFSYFIVPGLMGLYLNVCLLV